MTHIEHLLAPPKAAGFFPRRGLKDITNVSRNGPAHLSSDVTKASSRTAPPIIQNDLYPEPIANEHELSFSFTESNTIAGAVNLKAPPIISKRPSIAVLSVADDIDIRDHKNPLSVTNYVEDIYSHLRHVESCTVSPAYMNRQPHINEEMRSILVDWLVKIVVDLIFTMIIIIITIHFYCGH